MYLIIFPDALRLRISLRLHSLSCTFLMRSRNALVGVGLPATSQREEAAGEETQLALLWGQVQFSFLQLRGCLADRLVLYVMVIDEVQKRKLPVSNARDKKSSE